MKNGHVKLLVGLSTAFGLLASSPVFADKTSSIDIDVEFTFGPYLYVDLSSDVLSINNLVPGTLGESDPTDITVKTNNLTGYTMFATVGDADHNSRSLEHTGDGSDYNFAMVSSDTADASLLGKQWGYRKVDGPKNQDGTWSTTDSTKSILSGLPLYNADGDTISYSTVGPIDHTIKFGIGAKAADDQLSGTYENVINFTVVANALPCDGVEVSSVCVPYMQGDEWKSSIASDGTSMLVADARDDKTYYVAKMPDGKVWMTQNLDLELNSSVALTNELTDLNSKASWTPENSTQNHQYKDQSGTEYSDAQWDGDYNSKAHSYRPASDPAVGTSGDYGNDGDTYFATAYMKNGTTVTNWKNEQDCLNDGNTAETCAHWSVGTYYTWYAATAGSGNGSVSTDGYNVADSICPKGWHLPTSTSTGEFQTLATAASWTPSTITAAPYYFLRSGNYIGDYAGVYSTGGYGYYWSATSYGSSYSAYYLVFNSVNIHPSFNYYRYYGSSVRCVTAL